MTFPKYFSNMMIPDGIQYQIIATRSATLSINQIISYSHCSHYYVDNFGLACCTYFVQDVLCTLESLSNSFEQFERGGG